MLHGDCFFIDPEWPCALLACCSFSGLAAGYTPVGPNLGELISDPRRYDSCNDAASVLLMLTMITLAWLLTMMPL